MVNEKIKLDGYKCHRCGHIWFPRTKRTPKQCSRCKNIYWNKPKGYWKIERKKQLKLQSQALDKIVNKL